MAREKVTITAEKGSSGRYEQVLVQDAAGNVLGSIGLSAPDSMGIVCLDIKVEQGRAAAALDALSAWAAKQPGWTKLRAVVPAVDREMDKAVKKAGFTSSIDAMGNLCWDLALGSGNYVFVFACIGLALGVFVGGLLGNVGYGAIGGLVVGIIPGVVLILKDRKKK